MPLRRIRVHLLLRSVLFLLFEGVRGCSVRKEQLATGPKQRVTRRVAAASAVDPVWKLDRQLPVGLRGGWMVLWSSDRNL